MIKCVGNIWYCCLVSRYMVLIILFLHDLHKASTSSIPCIFLNLLLIRIQSFPREKKLRKCHGIFTKFVVGNLGMSWGLFFKSLEQPDTVGLFSYPLKTPKSLQFSDVFRGYRMRPVAWNRLRVISKDVINIILSVPFSSCTVTASCTLIVLRAE